MKRIALMLMFFATAGAYSYALHGKTEKARHQAQAVQAVVLAQTERLTEAQAEKAALARKVNELKRELQRLAINPPLDSALVRFLLAGDLKSMPPETENRLLNELGLGANSSADYVFVNKSALAWMRLHALQDAPNARKLSEAARGMFAITTEEQKEVEAAFTEAWDSLTEWACTSIQRDEPSGDVLVQYTIPADPVFEKALHKRLFSSINLAIGVERGALLQECFRWGRVNEDGFLGAFTNKLSILRVAGKPGLFYRFGRDDSLTEPAPITAHRFPAAFLYVFPGGWSEVAQREGFELPKELP